MLRTLILPLALLSAAACASSGVTETAATGGRDCFRSEQVRGYNVIDDRHVAISVGANDRYILTTMWNANDLDWTHAIALRSTNGSICTGTGLGVDIYGGDPQRRFPVQAVERAPEPAAAQGS